MTDLAFSLDSVTTAFALSKETWIILAGGTIGIIALRFMAALFVRWLDRFSNLEDAGFGAVALVGLRMLIRVNSPDLVPPQWLTTSLIGLLFVWGFSEREKPKTKAATANSETP
jgi:predicted tellurium resistance membrane protein TerC